MQVWELVAREGIRDIVARYNSEGDRGRIDGMMQLFAPDAVLEVGERRLAGADAIRAYFLEVVRAPVSGPALRCLRHHTATQRMDLLDERSATGRCYFAAYTQDGLDHWGVYVDAYCRPDERWLFRSRRVRLDGAVAGSWAGRRADRDGV